LLLQAAVMPNHTLFRRDHVYRLNATREELPELRDNG
jgi:transcriptional regulator of acetoin/glycerol metabolism